MFAKFLHVYFKKIGLQHLYSLDGLTVAVRSLIRPVFIINNIAQTLDKSNEPMFVNVASVSQFKELDQIHLDTYIPDTYIPDTSPDTSNEKKLIRIDLATQLQTTICMCYL